MKVMELQFSAVSGLLLQSYLIALLYSRVYFATFKSCPILCGAQVTRSP